MEAYKLPMRKIEEEYTLSELVIMGWQNKLTSYNMSKRFAKSKESIKPVHSLPGKTDKVLEGTSAGYVDENPNGVRDLGDSWQLPSHINRGVPIPKKFFNEEGNMDLRLATGPEAVAYLRKLGINLSIPMSI